MWLQVKSLSDMLSVSWMKQEILYIKNFLANMDCGLTASFFGTVEDNQFYVKVTKAGKKLLPEAEPVAPHGGRPGMYAVEELDDKAFLAELVHKTWDELPAPKPKRSGPRREKRFQKESERVYGKGRL